MREHYKSNQNAKRVSLIKRKLFTTSLACNQKMSLSETGISKSQILIDNKLDNPSVRLPGPWSLNSGFEIVTNIM